MNKENDIQINKIEDIIKQRIFVIRGQKVMLDSDLAGLYGVNTKVFNQAVKRNLGRFPRDFMFQLTKEEKNEVVTNCDHLYKLKFSYNLPYAFTEHGVAMLSAILNSDKAIEMSIFIVRAFIKMREYLENYKDLEIRIGEIEKEQKEQGDLLKTIHSVVKHLIEKPISPKGRMGFQ